MPLLTNISQADQPTQDWYAKCLAMAADPLRPVDWRWKLATEAPRGCLKLKIADRALRRTARWWARGCADPRESGLFGAAKLSLLPMQDPKRSEIESRALAGQDSVDIGIRTLTALSTVRAYLAVFFDVRRRLENAAFIHRHASHSHRLVEGRTLPITQLWRIAAYVERGALLEELLRVYPMLRPDQKSQGVGGYLVPGALTPGFLRQYLEACFPLPTADGICVPSGPLFEKCRPYLQ